MNIWRCVEVLLVASVLAACAVAPIPLAQRVSSLDSELVEFVAKDFAQGADCRSGEGKSGILLDSNTYSSISQYSDEWIRFNLAPQIWPKAAPLIASLRKRNARSLLVDWGFSDTPNVAVKDMSRWNGRDLYKASETVRCIAFFTLPSVSTDGTEALVMFRVAPSDHGTLALYVLRRERDQWTVAGRKFLEFL